MSIFSEDSIQRAPQPEEIFKQMKSETERVLRLWNNDLWSCGVLHDCDYMMTMLEQIFYTEFEKDFSMNNLNVCCVTVTMSKTKNKFGGFNIRVCAKYDDSKIQFNIFTIDFEFHYIYQGVV